MSCFGRCLVRLSRNCRRTSGEWGGRFPGRRSAATATSTSTSRSLRSNSVRGPLNTTTGPAATQAGWMQHRPLRASSAPRPQSEPTRPHLREHPGMSAFGLEEGVVYHTYFTYARGLDANWGMYQWLDRAPRGRNKEFGATGGATTTSTTSAEPSHG